MLNHDCQGHTSDQDVSRSITLRNREPNNNFSCRVNNRTQMMTPPSPRIMQPNITGRFHHGKFFSNSTPEISFSHNQNTQLTSHTYQMTWNSGNTHHTTKIRATNMSCNHHGFHDRRPFQSGCSFNCIFPHEFQNNHVHNPKLVGGNTS